MKIPTVGIIGRIALLSAVGYVVYKFWTGDWKLPSLPGLPDILPDLPPIIPSYAIPPDMPSDMIPDPMPIAPPTLPELIFPPFVLLPGEPEILPPTMPPNLLSLIFPPAGFIDLIFPPEVPGKPTPPLVPPIVWSEDPSTIDIWAPGTSPQAAIVAKAEDMIVTATAPKKKYVPTPEQVAGRGTIEQLIGKKRMW